VFLRFCCSCYLSGVWVELKGVMRVMPLSDSFALGVQLGLKGLLTVFPPSTPSYIAFIGSHFSWCSSQESIWLRHSFDAFPFIFYFLLLFWCFLSGCTTQISSQLFSSYMSLQKKKEKNYYLKSV
jgi:hypothetical protein